MSAVPKTNPREFDPVGENIEAPAKLSPSSLSKVDSCPRSFFFYGRYGGGAGSDVMASGSAWHLWAERVLKHMKENNINQFPADVGREWINGILSDHKELVVPESFHDGLRLMAWNFCEAFWFDPAQVISIEQMWEVNVGDWRIRGKIDLGQLEGQVARSTDWKTGFNLSSYENVLKDFKSRFYCLLLAEGHPTPNCPVCDYSGREECEACDGEGVIHVDRPMPILGRVYSEQVFPRYTDSVTGEMIGRGFEMDGNAISDFKRSVEFLLERVEHGLETGEWPAQPGSHCARCPAPKLCPIPGELNVNLPLSSEQEAQVSGAVVLDMEARLKRMTDAQKDWVKENGGFIVGDLEFNFEKEEKRKLDQKALASALVSDEPVDVEDLYDTQYSTRWGHRLSDEACASIQEAVANGESKASQARAYDTTPHQINRALERNV